MDLWYVDVCFHFYNSLIQCYKLKTFILIHYYEQNAELMYTSHQEIRKEGMNDDTWSAKHMNLWLEFHVLKKNGIRWVDFKTSNL